MNTNALIQFCNENNCEIKISKKGVMKVSRDAKGHFVTEPFEIPQDRRVLKANATEEEIVAAMKRLGSVNAVVQELHVAFSRASKIVKKHGLKIGKSGRPCKVSDEQIKEAFFQNGENSTKTAEALGMSASYVAARIRKMGLQAKNGRPRHNLPGKEELEAIMHKYDRFVPDVAKYFGVAESTLRRVLRSYGIRGKGMRKRSGVTKENLTEAMEKCNHHASSAAAMLGIATEQIYYFTRKFGIETRRKVKP